MSLDLEDERVSAQDSPPPERKRKRAVEQDDELEIDLNLPEPPSKKALRKLKKAPHNPIESQQTQVQTDAQQVTAPQTAARDGSTQEPASAKSEYAIWIGNMLWTTSRDDLRDFFSEKGGIEKGSITRIHMPAPPQKGPTWKGPKPINKGFAYVDFDSEANMLKAIELSETLLAGRKVLIKNAKSFEGRPETKEAEAAAIPEKEPSKKIFVGNLGFDTTPDDLREHFSQAGEVEDVFLTTFQDSGKCKGYGWVVFKALEAAQAAVVGYVFKKEPGADVKQDSESEDDEDEQQGAKHTSKSKKPRKWFINRMQGRTLRCEFAEDAQTRYKKRFNKGKTGEGDENGDDSTQGRRAPDGRPVKRLTGDERQALRRQKHEDARLVAPGKALAGAQRASAAIVAGQGKKTSFK